ncbi:hypothetical protein ACFY8B_12130 [Streptomyces sp. NPDC012751]|uniref:hypothetical protein n=1 Tax=Streptomyces sp. NPDC012751 TaxID=3364846 RepID=UPI0036A0F3DF
MTWTAFKELSFYWTTWTLFEALWIGMLWSTRSRVPGRAVHWFRPARRIRRGACERRVDTLLEELERRGVPERDRPDRDQLVDRWHRIVAGRCVSAPFQMVPLLIALAPFWPLRPTPEGDTAVSLKAFAALAVFAAVSIALMAADDRAADVSDPAGQVTTKAALYLETLTRGAVGRRSQDSALDSHGKALRRLCHALRTQSRHLTREAPAAARERVREDTERLIAALVEQNERYLLSEGADRETAMCRLARLVSNTLRHSCPPRNSRDSLVVIGAHLLTDAPSPDGTAGTAEEPLPNRLSRWAGWLAAAAALFTGAAVLPGGGAATDVLVLAGVFSVAAVFPPLRAVLSRAVGGLPGVAVPAETGPVPDQAPPRPTPSSPSACPHCADRTSVTVGSPPVR